MENPDPFPVKRNTVFFQLAGNKVVGNTFAGNGTSPSGADIAIADIGGLFRSPKGSVNNCFAGNTFSTSNPANIEGTWGCQNRTTPVPGPGLLGTIVTLQQQSQRRHSVAQPAPLPQPTMPQPCAGRPRAGHLC